MSDSDRPPERFAGTQRSETLAQKINLLLDAVMSDAGKPYDYPAIRDAAQKEAGYYISRTRWTLLKGGKDQVVPDEALHALAAVFGVDPQYLLQEDGELPHQVEAKLEHIRVKRRAQVRNFAARALGLLDPETFRAVARILDEEAPALTGRSEWGVAP